MTDEAVKAAIAHWAPRFVQSGVDHNDFVRTTERVRGWPGWLPEWNRLADEHARLATEAERAGYARTAGEAWARAAVARHFGKFVWTVDLDAAAEATRRSVAELRNAHRHLDPTAERITVPLGPPPAGEAGEAPPSAGGTGPDVARPDETGAGETGADGNRSGGNRPDGAAVLAANLRRPEGVERPPVVVLIPGLDSTKEEFFQLERTFLDRGMATVSVDGPGQGETGLVAPIRADYENGVAPLFDALAARTDIDPDRVGVCGYSLGGYYAPRVAAAIPAVRAMAAVSGPYRFADIWPALPRITRDAFRVKSHRPTEEAAYALARELDLTDVCARITVPALYLTGDRDRLVPWADTERQARETPGGRFVCLRGGNHIVANMPYAARPLVADWMRDRLVGDAA